MIDNIYELTDVKCVIGEIERLKSVAQLTIEIRYYEPLECLVVAYRISQDGLHVMQACVPVTTDFGSKGYEYFKGHSKSYDNFCDLLNRFLSIAEEEKNA